MATELDKFVLQYSVEIKDSLARLDKLNKSVKQVQADSDKTKSAMKSFASEAGDEIGKLVPGIGAVSRAVRALGTEFAIAGAAIGVLAVGIASVIKMREQYGSQRKLSTEIGFSPIQIEDNERKLVKASNGTVTPAQSDAALKRISELNTEAFTDPTGAAARNLRIKGLPLRTFGEGNFAAPERAQQIQNLFRGMSDPQVNAAAKSFGLDPDTARAMKNSKGDLSQVNHSQAEIAARFQAEDSLVKLNESTADLSEKFRELSNQLGEKLLKVAVPVAGATNSFLDKSIGYFSDLADAWKGEGHYRSSGARPDSAAKRRGQEDSAKVADALEKQNMERVTQKAADAAKAQTLNDQNAATVAMFAAAVTKFSSAIDPNLAIAAWAGEAGRGMGLKGPANVAMPRPGSANTDEPARGAVADLRAYDSIISAAHDKYPNIPVSLIKGIINTESSGIADKTSPNGINKGLMQISPGIGKKYGVTNPMDPTQNINAGVAEFAWFLDKAHGDTRKALQMYNGGLNSANYGPQNAAYPGKVLDAAASYTNSSSVAGYGRGSINKNLLMSDFASGLGLTKLQVAQGMVNKGDLQRESDLLNAGYRNQLGQMLNDAHNPNLSAAASAQMIMEANQQARALGYLQQFGPDIIAKGRDGGRALTLGATPAGSKIDQMAVQINVNGSGDPHAIAKEIQKILSQHINDIHNGAASPIVK